MAYSDTILATTGLTAYWPLDGDATDAASTNDGAATNVTFDGTGITGDPNSTTATFNGTDAYINIPDSTDVDLGNVFTLEFWIARANDLTAQQGVVYKTNTSTTYSYLAQISNNQLSLEHPTVGNVISGYNVGSADGWVHVAMTKAGTGATDAKMYVNGVHVRTSTTARTLGDTSGVLRFGAVGSPSTPSAFYGGKLAHVAMYKGTVLDDATILDHYEAGTTDPAPSVSGRFLVLGIAGTNADAPTITLP